MKYLTISELPEPVRDQIIRRAADLNTGRLILPPNHNGRHDMAIILMPYWRRAAAQVYQDPPERPKMADLTSVPFGIAEFVYILNAAGPPIRPYIWQFDRLKVDDNFPLSDWYEYQKQRSGK